MTNQFKNVFIGLISVSLFGCGTVNTVIKGDSTARHNLNQVKSPCESIPRIYSGVFYDMCALRGKPSRSALWMGSGAELALIDLALSGVLDTIALPYTIYGQINEGDINLR
ncbi:MAG: YceK/YidQ family lipoprotein [Nitrosomonas sp.]|nr:YceK/YidQ family lipoprotein [Nitrosomonas sp.]MBP6075512.1 YceK/YidQ family lipoprotein [Nitrosomonas sp.]